VFGTRAELRAGIVSGIQSADRDIADVLFPNVPTEGYGGWTARFVYDTRDRVDLPTRGWLGRLSYFNSDESLGSEVLPEYEKVDALVAGSYRFGNQLVHGRAASGTSFETALPAYDLFVLAAISSRVDPVSCAAGHCFSSTMYMAGPTERPVRTALGGFRATAGGMHDRIMVNELPPARAAQERTFGLRLFLRLPAMTLAGRARHRTADRGRDHRSGGDL
jgi:hypothetical protein